MANGPGRVASMPHHHILHMPPTLRKPQAVDLTADPVHNIIATPNVDELRRMRADYFNQSLEDRQRKARKSMAQQSSQGREPRIKISPGTGSKITVREVRTKHRPERPPEHRHRRRKPIEAEDDGSTVYVYRKIDDKSSNADRARSHRPRDSRNNSLPSSADEAETDLDLGRLERKELSRRDSRRKRSHHREDETIVVRTEQRPRPDEVKSHAWPPIKRSASMRQAPSAPAVRPSLKRSQTTNRSVRPLPQPSVRATPSVRERMERTPSSRKKNENPSSFFSSIFGQPKALEREKQVECLTCLSDMAISKTAKLSCGHRMCHSCLRRIFTLSVSDPQHMPPKCCTQDHIPLKHVDNLFSLPFKMRWNQKFQEYTTKNRIYCPARGCGEWIKPANIYLDTSGGPNGGRKYGKCTRCRTKVCCICNGKWHTSRSCPKDEAAQHFAEIAKKEGWQRCFNCSATVELKEGCNHMTCRCRAEFCMVCGLKWKTCDCPWFNYEAVENDRIVHMDMLPHPRRPHEPPPVPGQRRPYQEEIDDDDDPAERDGTFAHRMQALGLDTSSADEGDSFIDFPGAGINPAPQHFLNRDFIRRAADLLAATYTPAQAEAAARMLAEAQPTRPPVPAQRPAPAPPNLLLRQHSAASRLYNTSPQTRPSERVVPRRVLTDYASEAARHRPGGGGGRGDGVGRRVEGGRRHSAMAGLTSSTPEGRVDEWRRYVGNE